MKFTKNIEDVIADFRGLPRTVSASSRREPSPLDSILVVLQEKYKLEGASPERALVENWHSIFGDNLAERCHPVRIKESHTLIVSVTNQTLRSELQFMKRSVLRRIQALEYCEAIKDIVIRS